MKTVHAVWEKRNLGVDTVEFMFEAGDTEATVDEVLRSEAEYNVVKLPVGRPSLVRYLQEKGYHFVECMLNLTHDLSEEKVAAARELVHTGTSRSPMEPSDARALFDELEKGLFNTDRIYHDPCFGPDVSAVRYRNWINDEYEKGAPLYKLCLNGAAIGFFALKTGGDGVFDPFLLGLYNAYKGRGLGRSLAFHALSECGVRGAVGISTHISANNPANVKVYKSLGYVVARAVYVFVKHDHDQNRKEGTTV